MKRFWIAAGFLAFVSLAAPRAEAQTGTARGKVTDEKGQALEGVKVDIEYKGGVTRKLSATTNKKGEFTQVGLQPGEYRFTAAKDGFQPGWIEIRVNLGDVTLIPELKLRSVKALAQAAVDSLAGPFKAAVELLQAGKLTEAEAAFQDLAAKHPSVPQIPYNMAQIHMKKGDNAGAEALFLKSVEVDESYTDGYVGLSNLYMSTRQMDKAAEFTQKAAADHADDARLQLQLGVVMFNSNKHDEATAALNKALALDATVAEAEYYLGTIAISQNKAPEALAHLEKFLASNPPPGTLRQAAEGLVGYLKPKK